MTAEAPTRRYRRTECGWLSRDGEVFLERGAPMSDTGHPAWLVWIRAVPSELEFSLGGNRAWTKGCDPARPMGELLGNAPADVRTGESAAWFIHRGDEGWLADAKIAAEHHLARRDAKAEASA